MGIFRHFVPFTWPFEKRKVLIFASLLCLLSMPTCLVAACNCMSEPVLAAPCVRALWRIWSGFDMSECVTAHLQPDPSISPAIVWCLQPSPCKLWLSHSLHSGPNLHSTSLKCNLLLLLKAETWRIDQKQNTCLVKGKIQPEISVFIFDVRCLFLFPLKHGKCTSGQVYAL